MVLSSFGVRPSFALLCFQSFVSVVFLWAAKRVGALTYEDFDLSIARRWLPVNICFISMLFSSFVAIRWLAVPLVTIFKNGTNILILLGDWYWFGQTASVGVFVSLGIIVLGAVLAGFADIAFSLKGYTWMFINCVCTAGYVLYMKGAMTDLKLSRFGMAYLNNLLAIPLTLIMAYMFGELKPFVMMDQWTSPLFVFVLVLSGGMGMLLNLASLWCVQATSPSTYSMVGALNKLPLAVLGIVLFGEPVTGKLVIFISLALAGGVLYSYVKAKEAMENSVNSSRATARARLGSQPTMSPTNMPPVSNERDALPLLARPSSSSVG